MQLDEILAGMVFSGILERHPSVTVVLGESGLGWIPYVLERMDHEYHKYYDRTEDVRLASLPSELFHRHMVATYEEDELGLELVGRIGADNVMWASDYPHGDSTWPNSRQAIDESGLSKLDVGTRQKILWDTAARIYRIS
jgi:predicted TIM-barrel fold metal-dependent hydrolase